MSMWLNVIRSVHEARLGREPVSRLLQVILVFTMATSTQSATNYISYTTGKDSNDGASTNTPWKLCPGMVGFSGSYTHAKGDAFIFCGGDIWPNFVLPLKIAGGGSSTTNDYYGANAGWYIGETWSMPCFDAQSMDIAPSGDNHSIIYIIGTNITVSAIEAKNLLIPIRPGRSAYGVASIQGSSSAHNITIQKCYLHGWMPQIDPTNAINCDADSGGIVFVNGASNIVVINNTIGPGLAPLGMSGNSGCGVAGPMSIIASNIITGCPNMIKSGATNISYNSLCFGTNSYDANNHANAIYHGLETGQSAWIFANKIHDLDSRFQTMILIPGYGGATNTTYYLYNNLIFNVTSPIDIDESGIVTPNSSTFAYCYNNTVVRTICVGAVKRDQAYHLTKIECKNNHWISDAVTGNPIGTAVTTSAYAPPDTLIDSNNQWMTSQQAAGLGYVLANGYAPTSASSPTLGQGLNLKSLNLFTFDIDNIPRQDVYQWSVGAYEPTFGSGGMTNVQSPTNYFTYNYTNHVVSTGGSTSPTMTASPPTQPSTYYVSYTQGNDSNSGTSTASPWKLCPGMVGFSGTYTHAKGDVFIFCGGDTWPNLVLPLKITGCGNSVSNDYYGANTNWYIGGSWTLPCFDAQQMQIAPSGDIHSVIYITGANLTLSGIEVKNLLVPNRLGWSAYGTASILGSASAQNISIQNCYLHAWLPMINASDARYSDADFGGIVFLNGGFNNVVMNNTIGPGLAPNGMTGNSGCGVSGAAAIIVSNTIIGCPVMINGSATNISFNSLCFGTNSYDDRRTGAAISHALASGQNAWIYANRIHDLGTGYKTMLLRPGYGGATNTTYYIYNNLVFNTRSPIDIDEYGIVIPASSTSVHCYNNTVVQPICVSAVKRNQTYHLTSIECVNNHWISDTSNSSPIGTVATSSTYAPVGALIDQNNQRMTSIEAAKFGYTLANGYAPTSPSSPTLGRGGNLTSLGLYGTDILGNSRPVFNVWDVGAYQSPVPPSGLRTISR